VVHERDLERLSRARWLFAPHLLGPYHVAAHVELICSWALWRSVTARSQDRHHQQEEEDLTHPPCEVGTYVGHQRRLHDGRLILVWAQSGRVRMKRRIQRLLRTVGYEH
jgi:hypothetical protein